MTQQTLVTALVARLDEDLREAFEERAAIMEFDGGLAREHAECLALLDLVVRHPLALSGVSVCRLVPAGYALVRTPAGAAARGVSVGGKVDFLEVLDELGGAALLSAIERTAANN